MTGIYVDPTLREEIVLHLVRNYGPAAGRHALILAITGPTGEGKTFQIDAVLDDLGVMAHRIESGELESELAGQPAERIRLGYLRAGSRDEMAALVINDLDTGLGEWGSLVQYTVNRQAVFGQLMALCDSPTLVNNQPCSRVPIIVTGNDFTRLYGPLTRAGRMRTFPWRPSLEQRIPIIRTLFPWLGEEESGEIASVYPHEPVAFWAAVAGAVDDTAVLAAIRCTGEQRALKEARSGRSVRVNYAEIGVSEVLATAELVAVRSDHQNFLAEGMD